MISRFLDSLRAQDYTWINRHLAEDGLIPEKILRQSIKELERPRIASAGCGNGAEIVSLATICMEEGHTDFMIHGYEVSLLQAIAARTNLMHPEHFGFSRLFPLYNRPGMYKDISLEVEHLWKTMEDYPLQNALANNARVYWRSIIREPLVERYDLVTAFNILGYFDRAELGNAAYNLQKSMQPGARLLVDESILAFNGKYGEFPEEAPMREINLMTAEALSNYFQPVITDIKPRYLDVLREDDSRRKIIKYNPSVVYFLAREG